MVPARARSRGAWGFLLALAGILVPSPARPDTAPVPAAPPAAVPVPDAAAADPRERLRERARAHWAFQPLRRPVPPSGGHPVDAFVRAGLTAHGLSPQAEAPARDLVRRVTFDLLGLPPTPAEIDAFEADPSPNRFERLVDRLLARPEYGERWARHWLDLARFSESQGFEYDHPRDQVWPYRDYVIRSFNEDKPYDRFMREQIAGDVLEPVTLDGLVGPALLVCGPYDQAGNSQANATQRQITREEEMEDLISVVGQTFLGLTLNCARCHDHKFDPIPLADYYRIKAVFDGVQHGERPWETPEAAAARTHASAAGPNLNPSGTGTAAPAAKAPPSAYLGKRVQPAPTRVLRRGDVKSPGDVVAPGGLSALDFADADFGLSADAPEAERRRRFAVWLTDPRHPLPARVMVNRVWQQHFGLGLVATPSDFGAGGARPTHPELLDWLASEFIASGWSLKALHRVVVTSATYRQGSRYLPEAAAIDADNQWLWRFTPRRLEAEVLRDAILSVSGQLNPAQGGPSFRPFTTSQYGATFYHLVDRPEPEFQRRTIYRMNINSGKDPLLDSFDCPDPSVKTPRRGVTTTPLQALGLMNDPFVQRNARALADRALGESGGEVPGAIRGLFRLALGREPSAAEASRAATLAREHGLPSVAWTLFNSTEFLHVL